MPDLRCTVQTCTHNQNYYCNLDSIVVERKLPRQAVTALKREKAEVPMRMHTRIWKEKRRRQRAV